MPRWLLPWLLPLGMIVAVVAIAISTIVAVVLAVVGGLVGIPLVYRAYQDNRPGRTGDTRGPASRPSEQPQPAALTPRSAGRLCSANAAGGVSRNPPHATEICITSQTRSRRRQQHLFDRLGPPGLGCRPDQHRVEPRILV